jgi:hypothetical protein
MDLVKRFRKKGSRVDKPVSTERGKSLFYRTARVGRKLTEVAKGIGSARIEALSRQESRRRVAKITAGYASNAGCISPPLLSATRQALALLKCLDSVAELTTKNSMAPEKDFAFPMSTPRTDPMASQRPRTPASRPLPKQRDSKQRLSSLPRLGRIGQAACAAALVLTGCRHATAAPTTDLHLAAQANAATLPPAPPQHAPLPSGGVKGIYLTGWIAGLKPRCDQLIGLVDRTEINAMVIDVKDDGQVSYDVDVPLAKKIKASRHMIAHIDKLMATLKAHDIFPIARIACFRDTPLAEARPDLAVHNPQGRVWHDKTHHAWLNPYQKAAWDYNVDLALDAIKHGFKEIQFDYVRFPSEGKLSTLQYPGKPKGAHREDQIADFMKYAGEKIKAQGAWFSADVFGLTSLVKDDEGIGQKFAKVIQHVDYLCPMVYPSHYHLGEYHIPNPNKEPYKIVYLSVGDAKKRLKGIATCKLRPWIQDFSLYGVHYGPAQVKAQIKALSDLGIHEFLLWNAGNRFTEAALAKAKPERTANAARPPSGQTGKP